jgi:single-strand DNA-binding protein
VEGRLQTRKWTAQDGTEREVTEVVIDNMIALGSPKGKSGDEDSYDYESSEVSAAPVAPAPVEDEKPKKKQTISEVIDTDDIPF